MPFVRLCRFLLLIAGVCMYLQAISQTTDSAVTNAGEVPPVSEFVRKLQESGREEAQKSIRKYREDMNTIRQQKLLDELRTSIQKVKILLGRGLDTVAINDELERTGAHISIARDGIFENRGSVQTQRNLAVSSAILSELKSRITAVRQNVAGYSNQLMACRSQVDSIYTDSVLYVFPADSVAAAKYMNKIIAVVKEIKRYDSALERAVVAIPDILNRIDDIAFRITDAQESIEHFREELTGTTFARELPGLTDSTGFSRPLKEIFHFSLAKEKMALGFYIEDHYGRIIILLLLFLICSLFLNTLSEKTAHLNAQEAAPEESLLLRFPWLSAAIIVISIFQFLFLEPPFIFSFLLWVVAVTCLTILFRQVIATYWFRFWLSVVLLFVMAGLVNLVLQASRTERWFMLIVSLAGAVYGLMILLGGKQKELKERKIVYAIWFMVIFETAAACYNLYGRYNLSKTLFVGGVTGMVIGILFLWTVRLLNAGLGITSRVFKHPERKLFYINFEKLGNRVPFIFYVFLVLGWIILIGKQFYAFNLVVRPFNAMLTTERTVGSYTFTVNGLFVFLVIISVSVLLSKIVSFFAAEPEANYLSADERKKPGLGSWLLLVQILIISLGLFLAFAASGIPLDKITIILGALSVGIGLGLQGLVNNLVSGLILAFEKPVNVGDVIELGGKFGTMKSIGFRSSVVNMADGHTIIIPNGDLLSQQLVNWSMGKGHRKISITVGIAYTANLENAVAIISSILAAENEIIQRPQPVVVPVAFGPSAIELEISFVISNFRDAAMVRGRVIAAINQQFGEAGIEIPLPQQEIMLHPLPGKNQGES